MFMQYFVKKQMPSLSLLFFHACTYPLDWIIQKLNGGSVAQWLACWTRARKGPGSNRSRDAVG